MNLERQLEINSDRRERANDRAIDRMDREYAALNAAQLVGVLQGEKGMRYYINVRRKDGSLTGAIREFNNWSDADAYLIRNHYV